MKKSTKIRLTIAATSFLLGVGLVTSVNAHRHHKAVEDFKTVLLKEEDKISVETKFKTLPQNYQDSLMDNMPTSLTKREYRELRLMVDSVSTYYKDGWFEAREQGDK